MSHSLHPPRSRREALRVLSALAAAAALPKGVFSAERFGALQEEAVIPFTDIPEDFSTMRGEYPFRIDLRELRTFITPNEDFFSVAHYNRPSIDAADWSLRLDGLVERPRTFSLDDLKSMPRVERTVTFECSGNQGIRHHGMVGNAVWGGTLLRPLLETARPHPTVIETVFWAADHGTETIRNSEYPQDFARAMSLPDALDSGAMLAWEMNGEPLPEKNGYPLRLIVPGWYGIGHVKWLTRIQLSDRRLMNRFMGRDYVTIIGEEQDGKTVWFERSVTRQRIKSVIARVTRTASGGTRVFGAAWNDGTPIREVRVRVDGGAWRAADLDRSGNPFAWTFWELETDALAPGEHTLVSNAVDEFGREQPADLSLKKTYWEDNAQFERTVMVAG